MREKGSNFDETGELKFWNPHRESMSITIQSYNILPGRDPSAMANDRVLMWSATTLYAMSILSASSGPTFPEYGRAPVACYVLQENGIIYQFNHIPFPGQFTVTDIKSVC